MITIDGTTYNIPIKTLRRKADVLDKNAFRTDNGVLHRELIGVYFNYELQFGRLSNSAMVSEYNALWTKLSEAVPFHTVTVPSSIGDYTFVAYFANVSDELSIINREGTSFWKDLTVNFIAREPALT